MKNINRIVTISSIVLASFNIGCLKEVKQEIKLYSIDSNADTLNTLMEYTVNSSNDGIRQTLKMISLNDSVISSRNFLIIEEDSVRFARYLVKNKNNTVLLNKFILLEDTCYKPSYLFSESLKPGDHMFCYISTTLDTVIDLRLYSKVYIFNRYSIGEYLLTKHIYDSNFVPIKEWYVEGYGNTFETSRVYPKVTK